MIVRSSCSRLSLASSAAALLLCATAEAAETRYVASNGNNNNDCLLNSPCRTLQRAVNRVPDNGEVIVLDSGHFGNSLNINKSITISADSVTATMLDPGGITINNADAVVVLRGLHLKGAGASRVYGVRIDAAAAVHIERCTIEGFNSRGINLNANDAELFITDTIVRNNSLHGLQVDASNASVAIDNSRFENNGSNGVMFVGATQSTITRSISSGNGNGGITLNGGRMSITSTTAAHNHIGYLTISGGRMTLESSVTRGNDIGLRVSSANSTAFVSRSVFTDNDVGISNNGRVRTFENNILRGNGTNLENSGTIETLSLF